MAQPFVTYSILDHSNEVGRTRVYLPEITGANFDTVAGDDALENVGAIRLAMNALILGNHLKRNVLAAVYVDAATLPASGAAQRETKAQFTYRDTVTGDTYTLEIPTFDSETFAVQGTDNLDLTNISIAAFVTALETYAVSRNGNAIQVLSGRIVGRNV